MKPYLVRFGYLADCTLGYLFAGNLKLATIEDAWRPDPDGPGGQRREAGLIESCIPDGTYQLVPHNGTKFQNVWCMVNQALGIYRQPGDIPAGQKYGRSACLIHGGNSADSVLGCTAIGLQHAIVNGKHWVTDSQKALEMLRAVLGTTLSYEYQIRPVTGTAEKL